MVDAGFNVILLAFFLSNAGPGAFDAALVWQQVPQNVQKSTMAYAHSKGAIVVVSAGGETDKPYLTYTGTQYGTAAANWAVANNLDGAWRRH